MEGRRVDRSRRQFLEIATGAALTPGLVSKANAQAQESNVPPLAAKGFRIHPAIGIARLGDSGANLQHPFDWPETFYAAPDEIGGLPLEFDPSDPSKTGPVRNFKDKSGQMRRQVARFRICREDGKGGSMPVSLTDEDIQSIRWTVHIANKKAAWYDFSEFRGNLMFGEKNSYATTGVPLRNAIIKSETDRQKRLIIDPGPRTVGEPGNTAHFQIPGAGDQTSDYDFVSFRFLEEVGSARNSGFPIRHFIPSR